MKKLLTVAAISLTLAPAGVFAAAQSKGQQKCINALNKAMAKVSDTQLKGGAKCITGFAKGKNADAETCFLTLPKVDAAQGKTTTAETKKCTGTPPDFGKTSAATVNSVSEGNAQSLAYEIFSFNPNATITLCATDKPGCKCQAKVLKGVNKLYATHLKQYNKCKKKGLKDKVAPITDVTGLDACVTSDVKMKIAKAEAKLTTAINKKCASVTTPFSGGSCAAQTGSMLSDCLAREVRCHACFTMRFSDGLSINCDSYDDGIFNGTCGGD